jgi:2,4-dienoyl-CoA reductase-like NADH-dependent reductase (Old Yellow Enzyme family)
MTYSDPQPFVMPRALELVEIPGILEQYRRVAENARRAGFGELFLANPDLPERCARDAPLNAPDTATFFRGDEHGYTDYPILDMQ